MWHGKIVQTSMPQQKNLSPNIFGLDYKPRLISHDWLHVFFFLPWKEKKNETIREIKKWIYLESFREIKNNKT